MKRFLVLLSIIILGYSVLWSQDIKCDITLQGKVLDSATNLPLMYGRVYIPELSQGIYTDSLGDFKFKGICPKDTFSLCFSHLNSHDHCYSFSLKKDTFIQLTPEIDNYNLETLIVTVDNHEELAPHDKISTRELIQNSGKPLAKTLQEIPGVSSLNMGNSISKPVIHGMHSNRVLVMYDGIRFESQQWGDEHAPEIDPFLVKEMSVIKGAESVEYGSDAIAGVVLTSPKKLPNQYGVGGDFDNVVVSNGRMVASSLSLEGKHNIGVPISWRLQGSLKSGGNVKTPRYYMDNTGVREHNFSANVAHNGKDFGIDLFYSQFNTKIAVFKGAHINNLTDLNDAFLGKEPIDTSGFKREIIRPYQDVYHSFLKVGAYWYPNSDNKLSISYSRQYNLREEYDKHKPRNDSLAALNLPELKFIVYTNNYGFKWENEKNKNHKSSFGVNIQSQGNAYRGRFLIPNFTSTETGLFTVQKVNLSNWKLVGGVRYDFQVLNVYTFDDFDNFVTDELFYNNLSFNLGGSRELSKTLKWSLNGGYAWRPPSINELYIDGLHHGIGALEKGDKDIDEEKVWNINNTFHFNNKRFDVEFTLFYNYFENFIFAEPDSVPVLTISGAYPSYNYKQTKATFYGADLMAKYQSEIGLYLVNKSSLVFAYDLSGNTYINGIPSPNFINKIGFEFKDKRKFSNTYLEFIVNNVLEQTRYDEGTDYAPPPPAYTLLGVQFGTSVEFSKKMSMNINFSIDNLLNTEYRDYLNFYRFYSDDLGRNFTINIQIPFNYYKS